MAIVDNGIYVDGRRVASPSTLDETFAQLREGDGMAWIGLYRPDESELRELAAELGLHELVIEDALTGHQRAKLERYGSDTFVVLRPARYLDETEEVEFGEVHVFVGPRFVVTVRHAEAPDLGRVRRRLEASPDLLGHGTMAVFYAIIDEVVDGYQPVIAGLENDIDEIENDLFDANADISLRIFGLAREVIDFQRAVEPLTPMLERLQMDAASFGINIEIARSLRDVHDHAIRVIERASAFRAILENALIVHSTIVTQQQNALGLQQNEQVKKVSGWAAILFAPTLVGGIYGMNFDLMPELHWAFGYPMALALMLASSVTLFTVFKTKGWL
ncbi:MAG TPA: magnesium and cobalt transport protein CorA [Microbacteriaceae bacterium]|nr:magnesium and cobalt transport protein CorA [Microbacteriaceae bacterium]HQX34860.1 magnesium and cobalt transport protein CorA [Microbacteriaceae bacterium]HQZ48582.1 magnesium and cobalt transport protein CorA [Microbacteriaceae bacterium]HRA09627.1 magnesium and cobalt transport protein CorA [Microbacteriaceae bacterium]